MYNIFRKYGIICIAIYRMIPDEESGIRNGNVRVRVKPAHSCKIKQEQHTSKHLPLTGSQWMFISSQVVLSAPDAGTKLLYHDHVIGMVQVALRSIEWLCFEYETVNNDTQACTRFHTTQSFTYYIILKCFRKFKVTNTTKQSSFQAFWQNNRGMDKLHWNHCWNKEATFAHNKHWFELYND